MEYKASFPYPEIRVEESNPFYAAAMLSNIGGANSEMSAVSLYFYNSLIGGEGNAQIFRQISIVEMHHLDIFGRLAYLLGANPRLWEQQSYRMVYWTPDYNQYPVETKALLRNSLEGEMAAIEKYTRQAQEIRDPYILANLQRIINDEEVHVRIFESLLSGC